ncbi:peptide ABC transporter substrate-binding protein [Baaleninema sp.]|uniref:peptide ABC transporter substrate-binding protein n=1 Tax=Baaleninema sp. TaxID=3101197 RepID=UPI003CFF9AF2
MSFPVRRLFAASLLSLSLLSGCTGNAPVVENNPQVLRMLSWQAPTILNPHLSTGFKDWEASRVTLEPLATYDAEGQMVPLLAAEVPTLDNGGVAADGMSVTWQLKPDVKWSDGTPLTAEDVVFTYNYVSNPEVGATNLGVYQTIESVEALDETTVRVNFKRPNPAWSLPFVGASGVILPKHIFEDYSGANAREAPANLMPVGTGPYRVVEFKPGDVVVYEPNPYYREAERLSFQRIELKGGGDATSAARAVLQTGDADFADNLQVEPQVLERLETGGTGRSIASFGPLGERIEFNYTDPDRTDDNGHRSTLAFPHPFFTDETVRKAFDLAIDRDAIATQLYGKAGQPIANFLLAPPQYVSPNTRYEFNLEKAAELLDEAGWTDSNNNGIRDKNGVEMEVVFQTSTTPVRQKTQEIIKQGLSAIDVGVELKSVDSSIFFSGDPSNPDTLGRFVADLQMFTTGNSHPDPAIYMKTYTCDEIATPENNWSGQNFARYCNPEYDKLWNQAQTELDPEKRQSLFVQMNDLLVRDSAVIPIVRRADVVGVGLQLEGVKPTPWDRNTWNIAEWRKTGNSEN